MVSAPAVTKASIEFGLKVKKCRALYCTFYTSKALVWLPRNRRSWRRPNLSPSGIYSSLRGNSTTSGSTRSLRLPPLPFPCRPRPTKCCTSACPPSPPTLRPSSTRQPEPSACTSPMTWWAPSSLKLPRRSPTSYWTTTFPSRQIPQGSPFRLNTRTFYVFIPQVTNTFLLTPSPEGGAVSYWQFVTSCLGVFISARQALPGPDDETAGEDGENPRHHAWTQQRHGGGQLHGDGLCHPTQRHALPSLRTEHGRLHSLHDRGGGNNLCELKLVTFLATLSLQETSVSARVFVSGMRLAGAVKLNKWVT